MKKGSIIFGFKKSGNFIIDEQINSLEDFAWEMQYGKFICYNGKIFYNSFVKGFGFSTIVEGIENGLFWTCTMENLEKELTFWEKHFTKIVIGFLIIALTIAFAVKL